MKKNFEISGTKTKRLSLRAMKFDDFDEWCRYKRTVDPSALVDKKAFKTSLKREADQRFGERRWEIKIFERATRRMIGFVDVKTVNRDPYQICDVGYFILESFRGNGFAAEATAALIPKIFRQLNFHRLEFAIEHENKASLKVAKAIRLHYEGVRKHYWPTNYPKKSKVWSDQKIYVATPELFQPRR